MPARWSSNPTASPRTPRRLYQQCLDKEPQAKLGAAVIDLIRVKLRTVSRRRPSLITAAALAAAFMIAGCARTPPGPDPSAAARKYLAALKSGDYQTCYGMLAEHDLTHGSLGEFLSEVPMAPQVDQRWFKLIETATAYSLGPAEQREGHATVPVRITTPNLVQWERSLGAASQTRKMVQEKAEKQLAGGAFPRFEYEDSMVMALEGDEWRVVAGFETRAQVRTLHDQALVAYHQLDYAKALVLYRKMLDRLGHAEFTGRAELVSRLAGEMKTVEAGAASASAAQAYVPRLVLKNVAAKPAMSGSPAIFGDLVNSGDRALDQVTLTVSWYTPEGKLVYSERHTPFALPLRFADFELPLAPFAPGATRKFGIVLTAPLDVQQQNKAQVIVSGVILSQPLEVPKGGVVEAANRAARGIPDAVPSAAVAPAKSN
jgi:hypothetical protein